MTDHSGVDRVSDDALFRAFAEHRSRTLRNQLVERHMGLAAHIAQRFAHGSSDDVRQVAMLGLVKAVDRFEPDHGAAFGSFAGRTIEGEIKRHFRDHSWTVRVPRSAKDLYVAIRRATEELSHQLGRAPTIDQLAAHLAVDRDDVLRGLAATAAYSVSSLDTASDDGDDRSSDRHRSLASVEPGFDDSLDRHIVEQLLDRLPEREREIIRLRFYEERSQSEIADLVGVSQMHVSRLLRRSFEEMRAAAAGPAPDDGTT